VQRHIVLFRVRDGVTDPELFAAMETLRGLEPVAGAELWRIELSTDARKGRIIVEDATFATDAAFSRFLALPEHRAAGEVMARISDWWVGDYSE
jgi:hypothetical protein